MAEKRYYIQTDNGQEGPYPLSELPAHGVRPETWVWCKGMDDWQQARSNGDICRLYRQRLSDLMHPTQVVVQQPDAATPEEQSDAAWMQTRLARYVKESGGELPPPGEQRYNLQTPPSNWLLPAIVATLFFCFPLGALGIYYSIKSSRKWKTAADDSDREQAHDYARRAKMLTLISFFVALIFMGYVAMKSVG